MNENEQYYWEQRYPWMSPVRVERLTRATKAHIAPLRDVTIEELQKDYPMVHKQTKHADGHPTSLQGEK